MKNLLKAPVAALLAVLARGIVRRYKPRIVMVTGSVGKTSTKDAAAAALSAGWYVRASEKSYNSEFGVPLTVIGAKNPWNNPLGWLKVFQEAFALLILPNHYPKMLVLEVGADRPGDLARILRIATPDAVIVTRLPDVPVHVEAYASPEAVREEEFAPAYALAPGAPLVVASRDEHALQYAKRLPARLMTSGFADAADAAVSEVGLLVEDGKPAGMRAQVEIDGTSHPLVVRGAIGRQQLLAPAAALLLAHALGLSIAEALEGLSDYVPPAGRGRLLKGKNGSLLIDDSYNASPAAVEEALEGLASVPAERRIAVLGDMLELGRYSVTEHERIGKAAAARADVLAAVGIRARALADAAEAAGMPAGNVHRFDSADAAAKALLPMLREGDAVLVKGSQSVRTERVVSALLADPADAVLLVRQERQWQKRR